MDLVDVSGSQNQIKTTWGDFGNSQVSNTSQDENKIVKNQEQLDSNKMTEVKIKKYVDTRPPEQKVFYDQDLLELIFSHIPIGKYSH